MKRYKNYKLCYVVDGLAYFTIREIEDQWGDDWNDSPYQCNAGEPYFNDKNEIIKIYFITDDYKEPYEGCSFYYSVEMINEMKVPWLKSLNEETNPSLFAGVSVKDFLNTIKESGGEVFIPLKLISLD